MRAFSYFCGVVGSARNIEIIGGVVPPWELLWMEDIKLGSPGVPARLWGWV